MFEQLISLFTRLVVSFEIIAASVKANDLMNGLPDPASATDPKVNQTIPPKGKGKKVEDQEPEPETEEDKTPAKGKGKAAAGKKAPAKGKKSEVDVDLTPNRDKIKYYADLLADHEDEDANDALSNLLGEYDVTSVKKIVDEDVIAFEKELRTAAEEYFDFED